LQLREREADGTVTREAFAEVPPRVEYELTAIGRGLLPICEALHHWGGRHRLERAGAVSALSHESV
jgi:DNA-binding HxlR family transcriptional regulator